MSEAGGRHLRARGVLWHSGPDVVIVRNRDDPDNQLIGLAGGARLLWLALEQPATAEEVATALTAPAAEVEQALEMLRQHRLVISP